MLSRKYILYIFMLALPLGGFAQKTENASSDLSKLSVAYPNPANSAVFMDYIIENGLVANVVIYSVLGAEVSNTRVAGSGKVSIDVSNFPAGSYFYSLVTDKGSSGVKRLAVVKY